MVSHRCLLMTLTSALLDDWIFASHFTDDSANTLHVAKL